MSAVTGAISVAAGATILGFVIGATLVVVGIIVRRRHEARIRSSRQQNADVMSPRRPGPSQLRKNAVRRTDYRDHVSDDIDLRLHDDVGERRVDTRPMAPADQKPVSEPRLRLEQLIAQEIVRLHREEQLDQHRLHVEEELVEKAEMSRLVAEARDLIVDLNQEFGWTPGEPSIADRLFNTNVAAVLGAAVSKGKVDFRTKALIARMRSFARAPNGGRSELAKVMAVRTLLGTGRLTEEEVSKLAAARRLFGDDFAEAAGYVDRLTRAQEVVIARRLGVSVSKLREQDGATLHDRAVSIEMQQQDPDSRSIGDGHNSLP